MTNPFAQLLIANRLPSGTWIRWVLNQSFRDAGPYVFQLEVGRAINAETWEEVGGPLVDALGVTVTDETQRLFGTDLQLWYRVRLSTALGEYISNAYPTANVLSHTDRLGANNLQRGLCLLLNRKGTPGKLLKRRMFGTLCPGIVDPEAPTRNLPCRDWDSGTVVNSSCTSCYGVGILGGYYPPVNMMLAQKLNPTRRHVQEENRGTSEDVVIAGQVLAYQNPGPLDAWIDCNSDRRYYVDAAEVSGTFRGIPLAYNLELRLAPYSDPIYRVPVYGEYPYGGYDGGYAEV